MTLEKTTRIVYCLLGIAYVLLGVGAMLLPTGWVPRGVKGGEGLRLAEFVNLRQLVDQILGR